MGQRAETGEGQRTRVVAELRALLEAGGLEAEDGRLPPLRELAQRLGAGRNTMEDALEELKRQGLVYARARVGYFVRNRARGPRAASEDDCCRGVWLWPGVGHVAEDFALTPEWRSHAEDALRQAEGESLLRSVPCDGSLALREAIASRCAPPGFTALDPAHLVVGQGASSALALALSYAVEQASSKRIAVENPSFLPFDLHDPVLRGVELVPIPRTVEGFDTDALAQECAKGLAAIVVNPTLQNPLGGTLPLSVRFAIAATALASKTLVVELGPQDLLVPPPERLPSIASLNPERTLYVSSLSKVLGVGLRVGWLVGTPGFRAWHKGRNMRPFCNYAPVFLHDLARGFLVHDAFERHLETLRSGLARNGKLMGALADESGLGRVEYGGGGLFARLLLKEGEAVGEVCRAAREEGLFLRSDVEFFWQGKPTAPRWLRLNLSHCSNEAGREIFRLLLSLATLHRK